MGASQSSEEVATPMPTRTTILFFSAIDIPAELIEIILDMAQYWPSVRSERFLDVAVKSARREGSPYPTAEWCYLVSPRTESCDQGWAVSLSIVVRRCTYNGSWTWFEATIIRSDDDSTPWWVSGVERSLPVDLYREGLDRSAAERDAALSCEVRLPDLDRSRWHVTSNLTAVKTYKENVVHWTAEDPKDIDNDIPPGHRHARGIYGRDADFVNLMQSGDRVALLVMTKFPMWTNNIRQASITVHYSI
ncbi:hypothetical protein BDZ89DRAFT_1065162 [Hymenopellis radicata]|nr:hypothetical protein BDZ89DRAFT_1065162 [Hymenopellis radicata]